MPGCMTRPEESKEPKAPRGDATSVIEPFCFSRDLPPNRTRSGEIANDCNCKSAGAQIAGQPSGSRDTQNDRDVLRCRPVGVADAGVVWLRSKCWLLLAGRPMVRFLPNKLTPRERRALERLTVEADMTAVSPQVKRRLELLGLAYKFEGGLFITYDGVLVFGREKLPGRRMRRADGSGGNVPSGRPEAGSDGPAR
jgi:hypothetical protein